MNKVFCFVGSSGTGKSTLLNYIRENYYIECKELSARPFLPKDGSYDKTLTDNIQMNILFNNTTTILKAINSDIEKQNFVFSRSPIDVLSYAKVLNKGLCCENQQYDLISFLKDKIIWLYLPIEFELKDLDDTQRGTNEEVREKTDFYIRQLIDFFKLEYFSHFYTIKGSIENRYYEIDKIMQKFGIVKKFDTPKILD